jgi:hypothetical protein
MNSAIPMLSLLVAIAVQCFFSTELFAQRTWSSSNGKFQVEAALIGGNSKSIKLEKLDGEIIEVPLRKLSDEDRRIAEAELQRISRQKVWRSELKALCEVVSMSYRVKNKFHGIQLVQPDYLKRVDRLRKKTFQNQSLGIHALEMSEILKDKARWQRVAAGMENAEPLTVAQIEQRLRSMKDAFNAGLGDEDAKLNMVDHFIEMQRQLSNDRAKASQNQRVLDKELFRNWEELTHLVKQHSGPFTDRKLLSLNFEASWEDNGGLRGVKYVGGKLLLKNESKVNLLNVVLKLRSRITSGATSPKTFYLFVPNWRRAQSIELSPDFYDILVTRPSEQVEAGLRIEIGDTALVADLWSEEMSREQIGIVVSKAPNVKAKETRTKTKFGPRKVTTTTLSARFEEN